MFRLLTAPLTFLAPCLALPILTIAVVAQDTSPKAQPMAGPAASALRYRTSETAPIYEIQIDADFGSPRYDRGGKITLPYTIEQKAADELRVKTERIESPRRSSFSSQHDFFKLGPFRIASYGTKCVLDDQGHVTQVDQAEWLCALPFDIGRLPFPELSDEQEWSTADTVSLVRNARYSRHLQLLPLSPKISPGRDRLAFQRSQPSRMPAQAVAAIANTTRRVAKRSPEGVLINESYSLDGSGFEPEVSIAGEGTILFSTALGLVDSIRRNYRITMKSPNREMVVPISVQVTRLSGQPLTAYLDAKEKIRQQELRARQEAQAMEAALPELSDREAVTALLRNGEEKRYQMLVRKLEKENIENDPPLAHILYARYFERGRLDFTTKKVIIRLDPSLEKTLALAEKYTIGSVDVSLLGDLVTPEADLKSDQMVFYQPYGSTWTYGRFYGAVEDVLVLQTKERQPKLVAIKRDKCRLPMVGFWDPKIQPEP